MPSENILAGCELPNDTTVVRSMPRITVAPYCLLAKMTPRAALGRKGQRTLQWQMRTNNRRCLATAASGSFSYETGDGGGVKFASRDLPGPTTHLAVVAKAGTRYQPLPGFSEGLEKFSFKVCLFQRH